MKNKERVALELALTYMDGCRGKNDSNEARRKLTIKAVREALAQSQECPHGCDDGACKECYMEQTKLREHFHGAMNDVLRSAFNKPPSQAQTGRPSPAMERFMTVKEVEAATGLKRLSLSRREKEGRFPLSIKLDSGHRRYLQSEVSRWIDFQIENARKPKGV